MRFCPKCGQLTQPDNDKAEVGKTCPFCQSPIKPGQEVATCDRCGIFHHAECWMENCGCTTYGCLGGAQIPSGNYATQSTPPVETSYSLVQPPSPAKKRSYALAWVIGAAVVLAIVIIAFAANRYRNETEKSLINQLIYMQQKESSLLTLQAMMSIKWDAVQALAGNPSDAASTKENAVQNDIMLNSDRVANAADMSRIIVQINDKNISTKAIAFNSVIVDDTIRLNETYINRNIACEWVLSAINNDSNIDYSQESNVMAAYNEDAMNDIKNNTAYAIALQELMGAIEKKYSTQYYDNESKVQKNLVRQDLSKDYANRAPDFYSETKFFYQ